jgi:septal ring factor EnvC (AmiA/AmiB activator)
MKEAAMIDATGNNPDSTGTELKFTAAQIEMDCPARLQEIGRETAERLVKARKQAAVARKQVVKARKQVEKSDKQIEESHKQIEESEKQIGRAHDHINAVTKLMAEAQGLCDDGGFDAFRKKFFPHSDRLHFHELPATKVI